MQAQTPQGFRRELLVRAHREAREAGFEATDDSQLVERLGLEVAWVEGNRVNLKITTPADLVLADRLLRGGPLPMGS
jgi:2-C-methyl-D-erythritol 4-phosphate cytidylyltransferase